MLYFKRNQSNNIVVTFTERAQSDAAPYYLLVLTSLETLQDTLIVLPKSSNLSTAISRYDKFEILNQFTQGGQYKYIAYESNTTALSGVIGVVETGLAMVESAEEAFVNDGGVTRYVAYDGNEDVVNPAPAPTIETPAGIYPGFAEVVLSSELGGNIYYTTDGTTPSSQNGTLYTEPFFVTATALVQARQYVDGLTLGEVANAFYTINPITLSATPSEGEFLRGTLDPIVLETDSEGALIFFTTDGTEPTELSTPYTGAISPFQVNTDLQARAFNPPAAPSQVLVQEYRIKATAPTSDTESGAFISERMVNFTNTNPLGVVELSINGAAFEPLDGVLFEQSGYVIGRVTFEGYVTSDEVRVDVEIQVAEVVITPPSGTYDINEPLVLDMTTETNGAQIRYTTNGSEPTESSPLYDPLNKPELAASAQVKAKGFKAGCTPSVTTTRDYILIDADLINYLAATGLGGDANFVLAAGNLFSTLKTQGLWSKIKCAQLFYGTTALQHGLNIKDPQNTDAAFRLSFIGSWSFSNQGADAASGAYANSFVNADTLFQAGDGISMGGVVVPLSALTNAAINGLSTLGVYFRQGGVEARFQIPSQLINEGLSVTGQLHAMSLQRDFISSEWLRMDGLGVVRSSSAAATTSVQSLPIFVNAFNNSGTPTFAQPQRIRFNFVGDRMTSTDLTNLRAAVLAFNTAVR